MSRALVELETVRVGAPPHRQIVFASGLDSAGSQPRSLIDMPHNDRLYVITYYGGTGVVDTG